jgi:hypothetical protein
MTGLFIDSNTYIAAGYDKAPFLFKKQANGWEMVKCLDDGFHKVREEKAITKGSFEGS